MKKEFKGALFASALTLNPMNGKAIEETVSPHLNNPHSEVTRQESERYLNEVENRITHVIETTAINEEGVSQSVVIEFDRAFGKVGQHIPEELKKIITYLTKTHSPEKLLETLNTIKEVLPSSSLDSAGKEQNYNYTLQTLIKKDGKYRYRNIGVIELLCQETPEKRNDWKKIIADLRALGYDKSLPIDILSPSFLNYLKNSGEMNLFIKAQENPNFRRWVRKLHKDGNGYVLYSQPPSSTMAELAKMDNQPAK